jgi:hypothetical protein
MTRVLVVISTRATQAFYKIVENILAEEDEKEPEAGGRTNYKI